MSSILEALKKLEDEKAARQSGAGHIAGKVVKSGRRKKKRPGWTVPVAMAAVAAAAVLVTYLIMAGNTPPIREVQVSPTVADSPLPQISRQPAPPVVPPQAHSAPPRLSKLPDVSAPARASKPRVEAAKPPSPMKSEKPQVTEAPVRQPGIEATPAQRPSPQPIGETETALPSLKVTGIGWQKDNADRLAIVNGRPVMEGSLVDGAKVEEIFPDRVRFSIGARKVDVAIGKTADGNP